MGAKSDKPPLPAPTETESTIHTAAPTGTDLGTELGTDVSGPGDERSSYSIPDDGTPVTIKAGHRATKSQTSLLIEYFEGGKGSTASGSTDQRKPSVRVRLTPSSGRRTKSSSSDRDRIKITQSKTRKTSGSSQRSIPAGTGSRADGSEMTSVLGNDYEDASSYASATEESNVSRNPIDIEIERGGSSSRRRRPASPLIPAADSKAGYAPPPSSDISVIPTDSFLDGSGGYTTNSFRMSDLKSSKGSRDRSPPRAADYLAGAAVGAGAATAADKLRNREGRERVVVSRSRDREKDKEKEREREKEKERERRHKSSKSRTSSVSKDDNRRRSTKSHSESLISAADSSVVSSALGPSHRSDVQSVRSAASKASSINNPKLLETVEDAIRRLILPELNALKREQSKRGSRRDSTTSSTTTLSRDDFSSDRRRSGATDKALTPRDSVKISKERRDREARNDFDDSSALSQESVVDSRDLDDTPVRSADHLKTAAAAAALGAAAVAAHEAFISPSEDKHRSRRRRRAEQRSRELGMDGDSDLLAPPGPLMPLMSDVNASDVTRASILSADTDRPRSARSASEEFNGARDFSGSSQLSAASSSAPSGIPPLTLQALGTQHANISHGDLKTLPHQRTGDLDEYVLDDSGKKVPSRHHKARQEEDDYDEDDYPHAPELNQYYSSQDVPPPLKYVPYMPEKRGLSPIPSVSGYTDTGSEHPMPLSRATHRTADSISIKSLRPASRALGEDDDRSVRSSGLTGSVVSPAGSELSQGQPVRAVGFNPDFVHPLGIESNVASLVDGSMLEGSALTVDSEAVGTQRRESMATLEEEHREYGGDRDRTPVSESQRSRGFVEYDVDEYGRKVPQTTTYRESPTASEAAITTAAVGAAADFLRRQNVQGKQVAKEEDEGSFQGAGVQRNRSFKERTKNGHRPGLDSNSTEQLANQHSNPKLGFSGMPDPHDPLPEIGDWHEDDVLTNPSLLGGEGGREDDEHWAEEATPRQHPHHLDDDFHMEPLALSSNSGAAAGAANQNHSRQVSQENGEWYRSPEDKKRDTLVTNPYEGTSPIANLPGLNDSLLGGNNFDYDHDDYDTRSPRVDEGYISQGPNKTPDIQGQGKGINFEIAPLRGPSGALDDPFYTSTRHMSGLSQGMASPLYDAATGTGIERIESKDIIALMQHLMVRDAQRSARDTEILVTLVRSATEMRNNFEDLKKLLADTEDVIITEVKENTEKTVTRAINGPRPYPGSAPRSIHAGSTTNTINEEAKKRSIFRRALKGLGGKSANDLGRIEDMLNQLLTEVDVLKARTAPGPHTGAQGEHLYDNMQQEGQYDQDHGYEPEGLAGTSTASHASQSGYLSIQSRGPSAKPTYDRKVSAHRISTVPEDNEEDHGDEDDNGSINYDQPEVLMTPAHVRADSVPLATPPQPTAQQPQGSLSNENTPRMDEGKKKGRSSWFRNLKVSRWSETTASSAAPESSRLSKQSPRGDEGAFPTGPSRSGSLDHYADNNYELAPPQPIQSDQLHTGFSEQDLPGTLHQDDDSQIMYGQMPQSAPPNWVTMTPEDPKYKAHRDSLNLQHPQPRQGQTERFKAALESQALGFDSPMSPHSADWAGSATSLNRLPGHQHQESYGTPLDPMMYQQHWTSSPAAANITATSGGPPRPPKEPLDHNQQQYPLSGAPSPAPENKRLSKLQKPPLPHQSVESGYGTMTHGASTSSYASHAGTSISPGPQAPQQLENRNLSGALNNGAVNRRPSGPRPMTPTGTGSGRNSGSLAGVGSPLSDDGSVDGGRRKRGMN